MKLILKREAFEEYGIFSELSDANGYPFLKALEHSYDKAPKIPNGVFECIRGVHRLHDMKDFETFEIEGVEGHDNILFHCGNTEKDSEGCVLLGMTRYNESITESRKAFDKFMLLLKDCDTFTLEVK